MGGGVKQSLDNYYVYYYRKSLSIIGRRTGEFFERDRLGVVCHVACIAKTIHLLELLCGKKQIIFKIDDVILDIMVNECSTQNRRGYSDAVVVRNIVTCRQTGELCCFCVG